MKSYGKLDASWDDETIRRIIDDAIRITMDQGKPVAIIQDKTGNVQVSGTACKDSPGCVCWTSVPKNPQNGEVVVLLEDDVVSGYTARQMVPRVHDALIKKIMEYGNLGMASEFRANLGLIMDRARQLVRIHGEPFIIGPPPNGGITVAPMSERGRFIEHASCVVTQNGCWSLPDRLPDTEVYRDYVKRYVGDGCWEDRDANASDRRSIQVRGVMHIYESLMEHTRRRCECFGGRGEDEGEGKLSRAVCGKI